MRNKLLALALAVTLALAASLPALAIVYGEEDTANVYDYVGAMIVFVPDLGFRQVCSGTLISRTVFLTAAHCTAFAEEQGWSAYVTFEPVFDADNVDPGKLIAGTMHTHPQFGSGGNDDPHDIAVIVLSKAVKKIEPASLPIEDLLGALNVKNGLDGQKFLAVGYGVVEPEIGPGGLTFFGNGTRRFALSEFNALNAHWLRLSQNQATDDGGTCYGDSGGPNFLGTSKTIAAITVTGDVPCLATNDTYRVDTPSARAFLGQFVTLP
ncbi:MAG: trypsin-like serine protease [Candidatus Limnocylindria bacterium]